MVAPICSEFLENECFPFPLELSTGSGPSHKQLLKGGRGKERDGCVIDGKVDGWMERCMDGEIRGWAESGCME